MATFAAQLQAAWADKQVIDVHYEMTRLTLWIVGQTLFNADVRDETTNLRMTMDEIARVAAELTTTLIHLPATWPTPRNLRFRRAIQQIHTVVDRVIAEHRQSAVDPGDLLSMLLHAQDADDGRVLTDAQVRDDVLTFLIAGHATTATALTWCWYLLALHPEVYRRLCAEVDLVLDGRLPTAADLPNLPYTLQVFKETLRLYPPAYAILRQTVQPLDLDDYHLPRGMRVAISPYTLHRRPDAFPDPERFDPDRWTPAREAQLPRYAYLPFSTGPRNCVGSHFALMEGQMVLATIAQQVRFTVAPNQQIRPELLTVENPGRGIQLIVHRRADR